MSIPKKHHYLPEFYLRRWASDDGKLWEFRRPYKSVVRKNVFPAETGYLPHLYAIPSRLDEASKQALETHLLSPLDNLAAEAMMHLLEQSVRPPNDELVDGWTQFLIAQIYRNPRAVRYLRKMFQNPDLGTLESKYLARRGPTDPATIHEYYATLDKAFHDESFATLFPKLLRPKGMARHIREMQWRIIRLKNPTHGLLSGDSPVLMSNGIGVPDGFLLLPLAPDALFLATNSFEVLKSVEYHASSGRFDASLNDAIARQAQTLVIASSPHHHAFVEKRLGRDPKMQESAELTPLTWKPPI